MYTEYDAMFSTLCTRMPGIRELVIHVEAETPAHHVSLRRVVAFGAGGGAGRGAAGGAGRGAGGGWRAWCWRRLAV